MEEMSDCYRPDIGGDEDDDGEGAEPGVSDGEEHVARDVGSGEIPQGHQNHPQRQRQRYQIKHPHLFTHSLSSRRRRKEKLFRSDYRSASAGREGERGYKILNREIRTEVWLTRGTSYRRPPLLSSFTSFDFSFLLTLILIPILSLILIKPPMKW